MMSTYRSFCPSVGETRFWWPFRMCQDAYAVTHPLHVDLGVREEYCACIESVLISTQPQKSTNFSSRLLKHNVGCQQEVKTMFWLHDSVCYITCRTDNSCPQK
uniref:Uncharacterized protein n=1 Tax=Physcomitrium patens TaxID=3218 RepID=A0A7I4CF21_PHYPA